MAGILVERYLVPLRFCFLRTYSISCLVSNVTRSHPPSRPLHRTSRSFRGVPTLRKRPRLRFRTHQIRSQ